MQGPSESRRGTVSVMFVAVVLPTIVTWLYFVALKHQPAGIQQGAYLIGKLIQFALPVAWVFWLSPCPVVWKRPNTAGVGLGLGFGLLIAIAMLLLYFAALKPIGFFTGPAEQVQQKVLGMGLDAPWKYATLSLFYAAGHSFLEEYYWRWFVFGQLRGVASYRTSLVISSLGFMAHHILVLATFFGWSSPGTWLFSGAVAIGGAVWAWLYDRSQSLGGPWASHCLVDAAIFLVGYDLVRDIWLL